MMADGIETQTIQTRIISLCRIVFQLLLLAAATVAGLVLQLFIEEGISGGLIPSYIGLLPRSASVFLTLTFCLLVIGIKTVENRGQLFLRFFVVVTILHLIVDWLANIQEDDLQFWPYLPNYYYLVCSIILCERLTFFIQTKCSSSVAIANKLLLAPILFILLFLCVVAEMETDMPLEFLFIFLGFVLVGLIGGSTYLLNLGIIFIALLVPGPALSIVFTLILVAVVAVFLLRENRFAQAWETTKKLISNCCAMWLLWFSLLHLLGAPFAFSFYATLTISFLTFCLKKKKISCQYIFVLVFTFAVIVNFSERTNGIAPNSLFALTVLGFILGCLLTRLPSLIKKRESQ